METQKGPYAVSQQTSLAIRWIQVYGGICNDMVDNWPEEKWGRIEMRYMESYDIIDSDAMDRRPKGNVGREIGAYAVIW